MNQPNEDRLTPEHRKSVNGAKAFLAENYEENCPLSSALGKLISVVDRLAPDPSRTEPQTGE